MIWPVKTLEIAHDHCFGNQLELQKSKQVLCIACNHVFPTSLIGEWVKTGEQEGPTGFCPACGLDTLLGDASPFPISDLSFGAAINTKYFDEPYPTSEQWNALELCSK